MRYVFIFLIWFGSYESMAQTIDYAKVITPEDYQSEDSMEETLVRLAWKNHPGNEVYRRQVSIAEKNINLNRWSWLKNLKASYNLNEFTIGSNVFTSEPANPESQLLAFPRYNVGFGISLGDIFTTPANVNVAKEELKIAEEELNSRKLQIRAEVLEQYYHYQLAAQLLQIRAEENEENYANFLITSEKFKSGEASLDEYNKIAAIYNATRATLAQQEIQLKIEKVRLESYVGVKLDSIME